MLATSEIYKRSHKDMLATREMGTEIAGNAGYIRDI
jgi:hypothetical protein